MLACISADGTALPPLIIHKSKEVKEDYFQKIPEKHLVSVSDKGFITKELFKEWLEKHFVKDCGSARPVLLILDNHSTHVDVKVVTRAKELGVIMMALPPHTSHLFQPLDVGIFSPLKKYYDSGYAALTKKQEQIALEEKDFTTLLSNAFMQSMSR